jgi:hypothetical protein
VLICLRHQFIKIQAEFFVTLQLSLFMDGIREENPHIQLQNNNKVIPGQISPSARVFECSLWKLPVPVFLNAAYGSSLSQNPAVSSAVQTRNPATPFLWHQKDDTTHKVTMVVGDIKFKACNGFIVNGWGKQEQHQTQFHYDLFSIRLVGLADSCLFSICRDKLVVCPNAVVSQVESFKESQVAVFGYMCSSWIHCRKSYLHLFCIDGSRFTTVAVHWFLSFWGLSQHSLSDYQQVSRMGYPTVFPWSLFGGYLPSGNENSVDGISQWVGRSFGRSSGCFNLGYGFSLACSGSY